MKEGGSQEPQWFSCLAQLVTESLRVQFHLMAASQGEVKVFCNCSIVELYGLGYFG